MRFQSHCWLLAVLLLAGCESEAVQDMRAPETAPWEALSTFRGEPLMSVGYPLEMGNMAALKSALTSTRFIEALAAFEQSPLPEEHSDKQAAKDAMVKAWRDAMAAAEGGDKDALKTKTQAAMDSTAAL